MRNAVVLAIVLLLLLAVAWGALYGTGGGACPGTLDPVIRDGC